MINNHKRHENIDDDYEPKKAHTERERTSNNRHIAYKHNIQLDIYVLYSMYKWLKTFESLCKSLRFMLKKMRGSPSYSLDQIQIVHLHRIECAKLLMWLYLIMYFEMNSAFWWWRLKCMLPQMEHKKHKHLSYFVGALVDCIHIYILISLLQCVCALFFIIFFYLFFFSSCFYSFSFNTLLPVHGYWI